MYVIYDWRAAYILLLGPKAYHHHHRFFGKVCPRLLCRLRALLVRSCLYFYEIPSFCRETVQHGRNIFKVGKCDLVPRRRIVYFFVIIFRLVFQEKTRLLGKAPLITRLRLSTKKISLPSLPRKNPPRWGENPSSHMRLSKKDTYFVHH